MGGFSGAHPERRQGVAVLRNSGIGIQLIRPTENQGRAAIQSRMGANPKSRAGRHLADERFTPDFWTQSSRLASI